MTSPEPGDLYPPVRADAAGDWHEEDPAAPERPDAAARRDKWVCMMPECLCPDGTAIDPRLAGTQGPWSPSVDHVVPLAWGGLDNARNKRAAHARCNNEANRAGQRGLAREVSGRPEDLPPLTSAIADSLSGPRGGRVFTTLEELRAAWSAEGEAG